MTSHRTAPSCSIEAHARGDFRIRTTYDGPEAGLRLVDARDLATATEAWDGLFGDDGLDVATVLAASRWLRANPGQHLPGYLMLRGDLDGAAAGRAYMASITALRSVLAEARDADACPVDEG